jgi:hypothetical protein
MLFFLQERLELIKEWGPQSNAVNVSENCTPTRRGSLHDGPLTVGSIPLGLRYTIYAISVVPYICSPMC